MIPKYYKSIVDVDETTAKNNWCRIVFKYPNAKIVEGAPLNPIKSAELTRRDRLPAKIRDVHLGIIVFAECADLIDRLTTNRNLQFAIASHKFGHDSSDHLH